ncbi:MFS transporter [Marinomonas gallaica]|uniref:MFS transporter n=1 Tax=Marinomonas gallaica TaxID=1806667 RepID=UPI003CE474C4
MKPIPMPVLITMAMGSPIALNALLPVLPLVADTFAVSNSTAQLSLSLYLAALAIGQLSLGGLINAQGLKHSLRIGLIGFIFGSSLAMFQWSIETLLVGRVFQGLGGAAMISIARALLVESYGNKVAPQKMGYIIMAIALSQSVAPLLGSYITDWFGWGYIFVMTALMGGLLLLLSNQYVKMNPVAKKRFSFQETLTLYQTLLKDASFRSYAMANTLIACCFYFFVSASPYITATFDQSSHLFGYWFMSITLSFMLGGFLSTRVTKYVSEDRAIVLGNGIALLGALLLLLIPMITYTHYLTLFLPMSLVTLGRGISQPSYQSAAIGGVGSNGGMAAGLMGFLQLAFGAICSQVSPVMVEAWPLSLSIAIITCVGIALSVHSIQLYRKPAKPHF